MTTVGTMTIVEFLRARLDEDERTASAADVKQHDADWWVSEVKATGGQRFTVRSRRDNRPAARVERLDGDGGEPGGILDGRAVAEHIARHDPARVLREVEAKRALIGLHSPRLNPSADGDMDDRSTWLPVCEMCQTEIARPGDWPCQSMRLLAVPFADHPDYDATWLP